MIQTILFPIEDFTLHDAIMWLETHNYKHNKVDYKQNFMRFRQSEPIKGKYYTITLPNSVEIVFVK